MGIDFLFYVLLNIDITITQVTIEKTTNVIRENSEYLTFKLV